MKKKTLAALAIAGLLISLVGIQFIEVARANPMGLSESFRIVSPLGGFYHTDTIQVLVYLYTNSYFSACSSQFYYKLDGDGSKVSLYKVFESANLPGLSQYVIGGDAFLPSLANGQHNLTVYVDSSYSSSSEIVSFTVKLPASTLTPTPLPTLNPTASPIPTMTQAPSPSPSPTVSPTQSLEPTSTAIAKENFSSVYLFLILGVIILLVIVGLVVYFRKRRK